jgi:DMSO/TMAO reductase YedYZ molybdopterin-dependent catalytic subunit
MSTPALPPTDASDLQVARQVKRMTRRSFATGAVAAFAGVSGWAWLRTRPDEDGIPWPLRRMLEWDERLARTYFRPSRLARTFATRDARMPRVNGHLGLGDAFDPAGWSLRLENSAGERPLRLTLAQIQSLPKADTVTELRCIEGWSDPVHWTGVRLADLAAQFGKASRKGRGADLGSDPSDLYRYVSISTPDNAYYVGLDIDSALHPQTLLCYAMNDAPLTLGHGAPLRLVIPVKYGIKNIKRIGTIRFTDERPADYWAERGYDWYAGH